MVFSLPKLLSIVPSRADEGLGIGRDDPFARKCWATRRPRSDSASTTSSCEDGNLDLDVRSAWSPSTTFYLPLSRSASVRSGGSSQMHRTSLAINRKGYASLPPEVIDDILSLASASLPPGPQRRRFLTSLSLVDRSTSRSSLSLLESHIYIDDPHVACRTLTAYSRPAFCPNIKSLEIDCNLEPSRLLDLVEPLRDGLEVLKVRFDASASDKKLGPGGFVGMVLPPRYATSLARRTLPKVKNLVVTCKGGLSNDQIPIVRSLILAGPSRVEVDLQSPTCQNPSFVPFQTALRIFGRVATKLVIAGRSSLSNVPVSSKFPSLRDLHLLEADVPMGFLDHFVIGGKSCPRLRVLRAERCLADWEEVERCRLGGRSDLETDWLGMEWYGGGSWEEDESSSDEDDGEP